MSELPPIDDEPERKRLDLVRNEQRKLTATWLNNIGVGSIVAGFIAPSLTFTMSDTPRLLAGIGAGICWLLIGVALRF